MTVRSILTRPAVRRAVLLVLLTVLAYLPATRAGFIWDDDRYVTDNALVQSPEGLSHIWWSARTRDYYPVLYTSFWLEWRIWGSTPAGYHLTNILLHAVNAILVWLILARLRVPGAWLCGLVFAVHPLNVASVAWISQRKNTLAFFFFLLAFQTFPWRREARPSQRYGLALTLFILSLLTKPIAIMFPCVMLGYRWWKPNAPAPHGNDPEAAQPVRRRLSRALVEALPFFTVSAICGGMTIAFQGAHSLRGVAVGADTLLGKVLAASRAVAFYVGKTLVPIDLAAVYPEWPLDTFTLDALPPLILLILAGVLLYRKRRAWGRAGLFAAAYFVLMLFPVLGFFDVGFMFYSMVADHWIYPALPALIAVVIGPLTLWLDRQPARRRRLGILLAGAAVLLLTSLTVRQSGLYRTMETLAADTVHKNPGAWVAHVILGNTAFSEGDLPRAERHYRTALEQNPGYWEALNGLGIVSAMQGRLDEAIRLFTAVLRVKPEHAHARRNRALAQRQKAAAPKASTEPRRPTPTREPSRDRQGAPLPDAP